MMEHSEKEASGGLAPEALVMLMLGIVVGGIAAALSFTLGRRER